MCEQQEATMRSIANSQSPFSPNAGPSTITPLSKHWMASAGVTFRCRIRFKA
jgi:hypothetical protein